MNILQYIVIFTFGIMFGSFYNVCIYRIPNGKSIITPPSHCTNCNVRLTLLELIPVFSYIFQLGKCRNCKAKISPMYICIELLTAFVFIALFYKYKYSDDFFIACFITSILIIIAFIDIKHYIIPNGIVLIGTIGGLFVLLYNINHPIEIFQDRFWWNPLLGALVGSGFLFLVAILGNIIYKTENAMGMGDVKIFIPIGLFLGWRMTIINLIISVFIGGFFSAILLITKIKNRKEVIPFGPFISLGTFISMIYGDKMLKWYMDKINF